MALIAGATLACDELTGGWDSYSLSALAAAHAENGDFKEAMRLQQQVVDISLRVGLKAADETGKARQTLKMYEAGKPSRGE